MCGGYIMIVYMCMYGGLHYDSIHVVWWLHYDRIHVYVWWLHYDSIHVVWWLHYDGIHVYVWCLDRVHVRSCRGILGFM